MKKTILIGLLFLSFVANSQKYITTTSLQTGIISNGNWKWYDPQEISLTIKLDNYDIYIYDKANTHIVCYEDLGEVKGTDDDGDSYTGRKWKAYDEKGKKCFFIMQFYSNIKLTAYYVMYNDLCFRYYIKEGNGVSNFLQPSLPKP